MSHSPSMATRFFGSDSHSIGYQIGSWAPIEASIRLMLTVPMSLWPNTVSSGLSPVISRPFMIPSTSSLMIHLPVEGFEGATDLAQVGVVGSLVQQHPAGHHQPGQGAGERRQLAQR